MVNVAKRSNVHRMKAAHHQILRCFTDVTYTGIGALRTLQKLLQITDIQINDINVQQ